ncbi:hypothetical protein [Salinibacterium sp. PAMC 21357]|uniref:hypothetical protein n=1 Tax=Salinibacterium sp. PAMC 21357 TaxID=1112215 RepID=UPI000287D0E5|nr:hypothetical protein [Salinibacterium sp. PAMC 21357]
MLDDFEFSVFGEQFRVREESHPDRASSYNFAWLNGPAEGTYGFSVGVFAADAASPGNGLHPRMTRDQLMAEARNFIEGFYAPGGIGEEDFPEHVAAQPEKTHFASVASQRLADSTTPFSGLVAQ